MSKRRKGGLHRPYRPPVQPKPPRRTGKETIPCPECNGMGVVTNERGVVVYCPKCKGRRRVPK